MLLHLLNNLLLRHVSQGHRGTAAGQQLVKERLDVRGLHYLGFCCFNRLSSCPFRSLRRERVILISIKGIMILRGGNLLGESEA
jgi:hypothetical protein